MIFHNKETEKNELVAWPVVGESAGRPDTLRRIPLAGETTAGDRLKVAAFRGGVRKLVEAWWSLDRPDMTGRGLT